MLSKKIFVLFIIITLLMFASCSMNEFADDKGAEENGLTLENDTGLSDVNKVLSSKITRWTKVDSGTLLFKEIAIAKSDEPSLGRSKIYGIGTNGKLYTYNERWWIGESLPGGAKANKLSLVIDGKEVCPIIGSYNDYVCDFYYKGTSSSYKWVGHYVLSRSKTKYVFGSEGSTELGAHTKGTNWTDYLQWDSYKKNYVRKTNPYPGVTGELRELFCIPGNPSRSGSSGIATSHGIWENKNGKLVKIYNNEKGSIYDLACFDYGKYIILTGSQKIYSMRIGSDGKLKFKNISILPPFNSYDWLSAWRIAANNIGSAYSPEYRLCALTGDFGGRTQGRPNKLWIRDLDYNIWP